jgi:hypothetical protein
METEKSMLQKARDALGYLSVATVKEIAEHLDEPTNKVSKAVSKLKERGEVEATNYGELPPFSWTLKDQYNDTGSAGAYKHPNELPQLADATDATGAQVIEESFKYVPFTEPDEESELPDWEDIKPELQKLRESERPQISDLELKRMVLGELSEITSSRIASVLDAILDDLEYFDNDD